MLIDPSSHRGHDGMRWCCTCMRQTIPSTGIPQRARMTLALNPMQSTFLATAGTALAISLVIILILTWALRLWSHGCSIRRWCSTDRLTHHGLVTRWRRRDFMVGTDHRGHFLARPPHPSRTDDNDTTHGTTLTPLPIRRGHAVKRARSLNLPCG